MKLSLGADHAGYELKEKLKKFLKAKGHRVIDRGTDSPESVDYPDFARKVARDVAKKRAKFGILICGSGLGMAMAANRVRGVRAAPCESVYTVKMARAHNDANILTLGARITGPAKARRMADVFLKTKFEGGRHLRRVKKIEKL